MFHYLFTNDLRIEHLNEMLIEAGRAFKNDTVPTADEDKSKNNNYNTLGFYFNLTQDSNCAKLCADGKTRKVVLNFIKKFQFPNPRTSSSLKDSVEDNITLAPMRLIVRILYLMKFIGLDKPYLNKDEIARNIFFNEKVSKQRNPNLLTLIYEIEESRQNGRNKYTLKDQELESKNIYWKQCDRQLREMIKILTWSGFVTQDEDKNIFLSDENITRDNKADIFEIINYNDYWSPNIRKNMDENKESYQKYMDVDMDEDSSDLVKENGTMKFYSGLESEFPRNRIFFGAPGTGKSYQLNLEKDQLIANGGEYERVTFYPDYSYSNFIGTYKPVPIKTKNGETSISYSFVPGPFTRVLIKALKSMSSLAVHPCLLIIEEINRADAASVFGDTFQLLDRNKDGYSEYSIQITEEMKNYLKEELADIISDSFDINEIRIPDNMFIWATMNSADQGVYPLDTAFKRRWNFKYIGINENDEGISGVKFTLGKNAYKRVVEWNELRKLINKELVSYRVNEDKLIGPYFIANEYLNEDDSDKFIEVFKDKVIMYLFDDAAKSKRASLFKNVNEESKNQYSKICDEFDEKGVFIFDEKVSGYFEP